MAGLRAFAVNEENCSIFSKVLHPHFLAIFSTKSMFFLYKSLPYVGIVF